MDNEPSTRPSLAVPILIAVITALGGITVAVINNWPFGAPQPAPSGSVMPAIAGQYRLGAGSERIITIATTNATAFSVEETTTTPWPFHGTVTWTGGQRFEGPATFDGSLATMRIIIDRLPDSTLDTRFAFQTDENGVATTRVDPHLLVPYP